VAAVHDLRELGADVQIVFENVPRPGTSSGRIAAPVATTRWS
jgi:hypothetical protein